MLAYAGDQRIDVVGLDDRQARELAQQMGLQVIGTVGLLLKAKDAGFVTSVSALLIDLRREGFYISQGLLEYVLFRAGE